MKIVNVAFRYANSKVSSTAGVANSAPCVDPAASAAPSNAAAAASACYTVDDETSVQLAKE